MSSLAYETPVRQPNGKYDSMRLDGVDYDVLAHLDCRSGYQGTVFQNRYTKEVIVAHRGTEFDRQPLKDGAIDLGMVTRRINAQADDAIALTELALSKAHEVGATVSVTGHSLGGALAQITAHRFNLPGEAFNPYGAAGLGYRVPQGVPAGAAPFTSHVMAGDVVSAASPHYGTVQVYALQSELDILRQSESLHGSPLTTVMPVLGGALQLTEVVRLADSHRMHHFLDVDGNGQPDRSVLDDPNARLRTAEDRQRVQDFRERVADSRIVATLVAGGAPGLVSDLSDRIRGPEVPGAGLPQPARESAAPWVPPRLRAGGDTAPEPHVGAGSLEPNVASFTPRQPTLSTQLDQMLQAARQDDPQGFLRLNGQMAAQQAGMELREAASTQVDQHERQAAAERDRQQQTQETATRAMHR
ncbi:lipase family protein [Stenotrophomonas rhizophila]|uniref:lipase family protein n=1 Tax=Stenotrophomonas rhizophila TaxID=216778 RepID=UPI001E634891|nr:hemolysin [Stenotrophomonas rhizophila]